MLIVFLDEVGLIFVRRSRVICGRWVYEEFGFRLIVFSFIRGISFVYSCIGFISFMPLFFSFVFILRLFIVVGAFMPVFYAVILTILVYPLVIDVFCSFFRFQVAMPPLFSCFTLLFSVPHPF